MNPKLLTTTILSLLCLTACSPELVTPKLSEIPPQPQQLTQIQTQAPEVKNRLSIINDHEVTIIYPDKYFATKTDEKPAYMSSFRITQTTASAPELYVNIYLDNEQATKEEGKYYDENEKGPFCIDHGMCDEQPFESKDITNLFLNQKKIIEGNTKLQPIQSAYYARTSGYPYKLPDNLKEINSKKFITYNTSSVPGGDVSRFYVTFINDTRITIRVAWALDRKDEQSFSLYNEAADKIISEINITPKT